MNLLLEAFNNALTGDEYYTRYGDIEKELSNYNFSGMIVYCNCDNPESSNFVLYFRRNFESLGLKCLLATFYDDNPVLYRYDGVKETYNSIASGRFQDNAKILNVCDIVVTNPPFSSGMAVELVKMLINSGKKFIIVGPITLGIRKDIIPLIKSGQLNCGYTRLNKFDRPEDETGKAPTLWWTNMPVEKPEIHLKAHYDENIHLPYDNYNAINCPKNIFIPDDYDGYMGVPITFIRFFNPNQFDLVDVLVNPRINGKKIMSRLIIKKKG